MKIILTLFEIQDYGGIVGDIEFLMKGLREHGHQVELVMLRDSAIPFSVRKATGPKGSYRSQAGGECNTLAGWYGIRVYGYGSDAALDFWKKAVYGADLIIHEIPGPKPDAAGRWKGIYDVDAPQLIAAHDAHFRDMYPHIALLKDRIKGISCTNHAGYKALEWCPIPRAFIGAAHEIQPDWVIPSWNDKKRQAVCAHVWKAWKNMDRVVRTIPLCDTPIYMGGDGIEARYMRSKDKCKDKYKGIWAAALERNSDFYKGLMTYEQLFGLYADSRVMLDMSFSRKFHALGNHFNRSVIESYNCGVLPICTRENMYENGPQVPLFEGGKTHVEVDADITPRDLGDVVEWAVNLPDHAIAPVIERGRAILSRYFDYKTVCLEYLKLAEGKPAGIYPVLETGTPPEWFDNHIGKFLATSEKKS